jgi:hypothetical protein
MERIAPASITIACDGANPIPQVTVVQALIRDGCDVGVLVVELHVHAPAAL